MENRIPYVPLTGAQKRDFKEIMVDGNTTLREVHQEVKEKTQITRTVFLQELFGRVGQNARAVQMYGVRIPKSSISKILAVKGIEWPTMCGYSIMVEKEARKMRRTIGKDTNGGTVEDFYQEGLLGLIRSLYFFARPNIKFITFATHSVRRAMLKLGNRNNPFGHWTNAAIEIHARYQQAKAELNGPTTFDEVVDYAGLDRKEQQTLERLLLKVHNYSDLESKQSDEDLDLYDVIEPATIVEGIEPDEYAVVQAKREDGMIVRIENDNLTQWEQAVFNAWLTWNGSKLEGWQTEVAKQHINPQTGEHYSKAAVPYALQRAVEKIKSQYKGKAA